MGSSCIIDDKVPGVLPNQELEQIIEPWFGIGKEKVSIQPASFDVPIADVCYRILDPRKARISEGVSIEEHLRRILPDDKKRIDLSKEQVFAPSCTYFIKLDTSVDLPPKFFIRSSPKSTQGRLGTFVRLIGDGCPELEEIKGPFKGNLWAIYETHKFHTIMQAGDMLNQLRVFCQHPAKIEGEELAKEFEKYQLLHRDGKPVQIDEVELNRGLPLCIDLQGEKFDGIIAFNAKNNPDPIHLREKGSVNPLEYFRVITQPEDGPHTVKTNEFDIMYSWEQVRVPKHLAMEMLPYHPAAGAFRLHKAGFFDPGFAGNAVLEVDSHERHEFPLVHGQSVCLLEVHRLRQEAELAYGEAGNYYQKQEGPRLAKQFQKLNIRELVEKIDKFKVPVMVVPREKLFPLADFQGFKPAPGAPDYIRTIEKNNIFAERGKVEENPQLKQPIPYVVFVCPSTKRIFTYRRPADKKIAPEKRLYKKWSVGVGGHVRLIDKTKGKPLDACREREEDEEVDVIEASEAKLLGYINDDSNSVSSVHFGLLYYREVPNEDAVKAKEATLSDWGWFSLDEVKELKNKEPWTTIALEPLERLIRSYETGGK